MHKVNPNLLKILRGLIYISALGFLVYGIFPCPGLTYDANLYLETAKNLGDLGFFQDGFKAKPPLYILILNIFRNNTILIALLNIGCWISSVALIEYIAHRHSFLSDSHKVIISIWVAFSTPMHLVHNFVWTEPLFLVLILLYFINLESKFKYRIVVLSIVSVLMVALRHVGLLFIIGGIISLTYSHKFKKQDWIWIGLSIGFFVLWQLFVFHLRGDFERLNHTQGVDIMSNYLRLGASLNQWIHPFDIPALHYLAPEIFAFLFLGVFIISQHPGIRMLVTTALSTMLMILLKGELFYEDIERYLFFVHPFLMLFVFHFLPKNDWIRKAALILFLFIALYNVFRTTGNDLFWHQAFCT